VLLRSPEPGDAATLIAGRDEAFFRWIGPGSPTPQPTRCIVVDGEVVGWVDYDADRDWLAPGEVNVGYNVFPAHRGKGYATRAVQLLMHHLALRADHHTATLLIAPDNANSLAVAQRCRFAPNGVVEASRYFTRSVPPLEYSDGAVTIRRQRAEDLTADLESKDDEQIDWLWLPDERALWEAMSGAEQRAHALRGLQDNAGGFGSGPKWTFAVDALGADCVAYVDCDLGNEHAPRGEANISYSAHPAYRGRGYVTRAVRLVVRWLSDHTGAREVHLVIDEGNAASLRVARSLGAAAVDRWTDAHRRTHVRHVLLVP
jgi:RimJ/RimL family protein N-acetyltransferase